MENNKLEWNLKEIFEDEELLESTIKELYNLIDEIKQYKGKLNNSVENVYNCYKNLEKALELHERVYAYAMLKYNQDMSNQESMKLYKRIQNITTDFSEAESFISPEMSKIEDERLEEYLKDRIWKNYKRYN